MILVLSSNLQSQNGGIISLHLTQTPSHSINEVLENKLSPATLEGYTEHS